MYPKGIKNYEEKFNSTKRDSDGTRYDIKIDNSYSFPLHILTPRNVTGYYYTKEEYKSLIVLHLTIGFLTGDIASLIEQDSFLSVPYVIGRNGVVYQLFDPKYWAYHLGRAAIGGNTINSKRSIGIELSNIGPLTRENDDLLTIYGSKYCHIDETDYYTKIEIPFRKYTYFATVTEKQYTSLQELLTFLCGTFNIPYEFLPEKKRYRVFSSKTEAQTFQGICTHINYRADGKVDIGPAFNWDVLSQETIV